MTTQSVKIIAADLRSRYNEIENEKNQAQFFTKIAHYGKYILENDTTSIILSDLYQDKERDIKAYIESFRNFVKVWKIYAKDILEKVEIAGIKDVSNNPLSSEIGNIKNKLNQKDILLWESDLGDYFNPYFSLVRKFESIDKSDLLIPKHFEKGKPLEIYSAYTQADNEWKKYKNSRETSVWWAHYQVCRAAAGILGVKQAGNYFPADDVVSGFYKNEFNELAMGGRISTPIVLHKYKFDVWIKRLHEYLIPRLENLEEQPLLKTTEQQPQIKRQRITQENIEWSERFKWINNKEFYLDEGTTIVFDSTSSNRLTVFKMLTEEKGHWVKVDDMAKKISKTHNRVRSILGQINKEKLKKDGAILIVPRLNVNEPGAYRIKLLN